MLRRLGAKSVSDSWETDDDDVATAAAFARYSFAISGLPTVWSTKRVAPTAVTQGDDAGHDGQSCGGLVGSIAGPPDAMPGTEEGPCAVTALKRVHVPRGGGGAFLMTSSRGRFFFSALEESLGARQIENESCQFESTDAHGARHKSVS